MGLPSSEESNLHVITRKTYIRKEEREEKGGENATALAYNVVANFPRGGKAHTCFLHSARSRAKTRENLSDGFGFGEEKVVRLVPKEHKTRSEHLCGNVGPSRCPRYGGSGVNVCK